MKKYKVTFEIYFENRPREFRTIIVEAGSKKTAYTRALSEISKDKAFSSLYKKIMNIEEAD